jgi:hypothetical protein
MRDRCLSEIMFKRDERAGPTSLSLETTTISVHELRGAIIRVLTEAPDCSMSRQQLREKLHFDSNSLSEFFQTAVRYLIHHGYIREAMTTTPEDGKNQKCLQVIRPYEKLEDDSIKKDMKEEEWIIEKYMNPLLCENTLEHQLYSYIVSNGKEGMTIKVMCR